MIKMNMSLILKYHREWFRTRSCCRSRVYFRNKCQDFTSPALVTFVMPGNADSGRPALFGFKETFPPLQGLGLCIKRKAFP